MYWLTEQGDAAFGLCVPCASGTRRIFFQAHIPFEAGVVQECFEYCLFFKHNLKRVKRNSSSTKVKL